MPPARPAASKHAHTTPNLTCCFELQEHLLIAFSGDGASLVMTHLIREARECLKGNRYALTVAHVLETHALDMAGGEAEHRVRVEAAARACGVELEVLEMSEDELASLATAKRNASLTAWHDRKEEIRVQKLTAFAVARGATRLLMGDTATLLAARVIADLSKNRPLDITRYTLQQPLHGAPECTILRPFYDAFAEEIALFIRHEDLHAAILPLSAWTGPYGGTDSLNSLCREFVHSLQVPLKHTIHQIPVTSPQRIDTRH